MHICPFCKKTLSAESTFCSDCGYSLVLSLPFHPPLEHAKTYLLLAAVSILFGLGSCIFSILYYWELLGLFLAVLTIATSGVILERIRGKFNGVWIRALAISGLVLGVCGYFVFIFVNSHMSGIGYSM